MSTSEPEATVSVTTTDSFHNQPQQSTPARAPAPCDPTGRALIPLVETVAVVPIVRRADKMYTISPTGSRHSQVVEHDAPDLGDEEGQHCAVKRRHYRNTRTPGKSARYTREHSHRHQCGIWTVIASSLRKMAAKIEALAEPQRFPRNAR